MTFILKKPIQFISGSFRTGSDGKPAEDIVMGGWEIDPDDGKSIQFKIPSASLGTSHDKIGFYISASGKIGIGTKDPESSFDVRDISEDVDPKDKTKGTKILNIDANEQRFDVPISASLITASIVKANQFVGELRVENIIGTLPVANGGTGISSVANKAVIISQDSGTDTFSGVQMNGSGELLIGGTSGPAAATLTQGDNIGITNGDMSITIAATTKSIEEVQDIAGAMFSSNTETNITATYQDTDGTIDLVVASTHKGFTDKIILTPTDFYSNGVPGKSGTPTLNPTALGKEVVASAAGTFICQTTLPEGRYPTAVQIQSSNAKDVVKVYRGDYTGSTPIQIDSTKSGTGFVAGFNQTLTDQSTLWSANSNILTITITTTSTSSLYGGLITMA